MEAGALRAPPQINRVSVTAPLLRLRSDEQLVSLFRAGNDIAFGVIHDRYRQRLFAYTRQMLGGSRADAEDALQDVFLRAYSALRTDERPVALRAWLYRVAHNRCIDQLRRPAPPMPELFEVSRRPLQDPMDVAERRDDLRRLVEDVRRLPEQQRSALLMREIDGLSYAEVADALDVTVAAVKSLLVRARIGLVEAVEARDTACTDIRSDLADTIDRGVRASARARRHLRDCSGCTEYRTQMRAVHRGLSAICPAGPGLKLLGLGGAGSAGGGAAAALGGGTAAKVAAVVCCAAITAGGAAEVRHRMASPSPATPERRDARPAGRPAPAQRVVTPAAPAVTARPKVTAPAAGPELKAEAGKRDAAQSAPALPSADDEVISPHGVAPADSTADIDTGGITAPDEHDGFGHGVYGLNPVSELPAPTNDGTRAPADSGSAVSPAPAPAQPSPPPPATPVP